MTKLEMALIERIEELEKELETVKAENKLLCAEVDRLESEKVNYEETKKNDEGSVVKIMSSGLIVDQYIWDMAESAVKYNPEYEGLSVEDAYTDLLGNCMEHSQSWVEQEEYAKLCSEFSSWNNDIDDELGFGVIELGEDEIPF